MKIDSVSTIDLHGKKVLVRCELNVPLSDDFMVLDESRIIASLPTLKYILEQGGKAFILSHLGRPWGKGQEKFSLKHICNSLTSHLGQEVKFIPDCIGEDRDLEIGKVKNGEVALLENVRFYSGETENNIEFSELLASGFDVYINDAFGNCHRSHSSMVGVPKHIKEFGIGMLVQQELETLESIVNNPASPVILVVGGSKVAGKNGKIHVIRGLLDRLDSVLIGGRVALFCLAAKGLVPVSALVDRTGVDGKYVQVQNEILAAKTLMDESENAGVEVVLPSDIVVVKSLNDQPRCIPVSKIKEGYIAPDIGHESIKTFSQYIEGAGTVIWNGPMGLFEDDKFADGTIAIAESM
jgi:phosphoglycerate kinase